MHNKIASKKLICWQIGKIKNYSRKEDIDLIIKIFNLLGLKSKQSFLSAETNFSQVLSDVRKEVVQLFMNVINLSNNLDLNSNEADIKKSEEASNDIKSSQFSKNKFKGYVTTQNHGILVRSVLKRRNWWNIVKFKSFENCDFIWTQWLKREVIEEVPAYNEPFSIADFKMYNRIEFNHHLSNKKNLFLNMK